MQWDDSKNAGFTEGKPWLPVSDNYKSLNVKKEKNNRDSILMLYHRLIQLREKEPALGVGNYIPVPADRNILTYIREHKGKRFLIVLNFGDQSEKFACGNIEGISGSTIVAAVNSEKERGAVGITIFLEGNEGIVVELLS